MAAKLHSTEQVAQRWVVGSFGLWCWMRWCCGPPAYPLVGGCCVDKCGVWNTSARNNCAAAQS